MSHGMAPLIIGADRDTLRTAARIRDGADSLDLAIVSPFASEERDAATGGIRALWPGHIRTVRVAVSTDSITQCTSRYSASKVEWADSGATTFWTTRSRPDTVGAVRVDAAVMVYPFVRRWRPRMASDSTMHVYARWVDGDPAAFERCMVPDV